MAKFTVFYNTFRWINDEESESIGGVGEIEIDIPIGLEGNEKYQYVRHFFIKEKKKISNIAIEVTSIEETAA